MIESRPDWVISRQRAWGVPITVFVREAGDGSVEILDDARVNARIADAFEREGADAWYQPGARERFLGELANEHWQKVDDILDVWFDSGSTHAFVLEDPVHFPSLAGIKRKKDGGPDTVMYLEGSDQHRGWFQSSLLESCGTRGRCALRRGAHARLRARRGRAQDVEVARQRDRAAGRDPASPAPIFCACGCAPPTMPTTCASGRKSSRPRSRPTASCATPSAGCSARSRISATRTASRHADMPELERLMLHRLAELDRLVRQAYADFDYKRIFAALNAFMTADLSAFYFDIRKDALYCDPISSTTRKACLTVLDHLFRATVTWLAPMLPFTAEEAWLARYRSSEGSVHLELFPELPSSWRDDALAEKWRKVRNVRRVVTGALEIERAHKRIGSSLEAAPVVYRVRPRPVRRARRRRPSGGRDHLGGDTGRGRGSAGGVPARRRQGRRRRGAARAREKMRAVMENSAQRRLRSGLSRRLPARRPGAARVGGHAKGGGVSRWRKTGPSTFVLLARRPSLGAADRVRARGRRGDRGDRPGGQALAPVRRSTCRPGGSCGSRRFSTSCSPGTPASAMACSGRRARWGKRRCWRSRRSRWLCCGFGSREPPRG